MLNCATSCRVCCIFLCIYMCSAALLDYTPENHDAAHFCFFFKGEGVNVVVDSAEPFSANQPIVFLPLRLAPTPLESQVLNESLLLHSQLKFVRSTGTRPTKGPWPPRTLLLAVEVLARVQVQD